MDANFDTDEVPYPGTNKNTIFDVKQVNFFSFNKE